MNDPVIDLSHWNEEPDWDLLKINGTAGVILKATEGTSYVDPTFGARYNKARQAGLMVSSYHFLKHGSISAQMDAYLRAVNPQDGDRMIIDYEDAALTWDDLEQSVEYLLARGDVTVAVYGSSKLTETVGSKKSSILSRTSLWQARYSSSQPKVPTSIWKRWDLWQYTDKGKPVGSIGDTDCNRWNPDSGDLMAWFNIHNGEIIPPPIPPDIDDVGIVNVSLVVTPPDGVVVNMNIDVTAPESAGVTVTVNGSIVAEFGPVA